VVVPYPPGGNIHTCTKMVSQSNLDHITREKIRAAASPTGTKAERPNEAVVARDQTKSKKTNKIKPRYRTKATLLNRIRYHNGAIGLLFGRRMRYVVFGFVLGYGMRFWQNVDEEATKRKEKEEERKKKKKKPALQTRAKITELPDDADPDFAFDSKGNKKAAPKPKANAKEQKMVLLIREDLNMSSGKVAAQCSHAAVGLFQRLISEEYRSSPSVQKNLKSWIDEGQKKVCLSIANTETLEDLRASFSMKRIPYFVVEDAGRTEVAYGTETVMAVGPCENEVLDRVTGKLRLFDS
jgi:PTH2 family peptidyl-tRNA hydrolase